MACRDLLLAVCACLLLSNGCSAGMLKLSNCTQSSTSHGQGKCNVAIDGNTNQDWKDKSITHTNEDEHPWWQARTEAPALIKQVRIYNRQDCCAERLNNFVIKVDDQICARYNSEESFSAKTFDCNYYGSTLKIESTVKTYLSLAEVQAFGEVRPIGMLQLSNCTQSSTSHGQGKCNMAIDGNTNQDWNGKSITHTNEDEHPWWQARTEAPALIKQVRIYNRQDCCAKRLNNFVIKVDGEICARYNSEESFSVKIFDCNRHGSTLKIESTVKTYLSLAEVQVTGVLLN